eukprot:g14931.t1 g14931   contig21:186151-186701(+)
MRSLDPGLFESENIREDMCKRMSGGRPNKSTSETTTFGEKKMWEKWSKMKTEMKKLFTGLPVTYHKMKSGTQLYEVYDNVIREHWKEQFCAANKSLLAIHRGASARSAAFIPRNVIASLPTRCWSSTGPSRNKPSLPIGPPRPTGLT